jgi:hypothetical protein
MNWQELRTRHTITCGGLYSDTLSTLTGCASTPKIVPFRGEYLLLKSDKRDMVKMNIYPVRCKYVCWCFIILDAHRCPIHDFHSWAFTSRRA